MGGTVTMPLQKTFWSKLYGICLASTGRSTAVNNKEKACPGQQWPGHAFYFSITV
ncbi:hypothetical protein NLX67_11070 [Domibacillus sp. A3M-37]|uniref:hypothetical protein n=1 Tax=Domibacillus sp. A3M-37 TaxID=2962037 RepID=UPI0020B65946|nr:hypothetical protein [Domibacillus sp. A3M-37]MCP3762929.1 hypothetical protein [Domibacillus sp. A3M-37]